MTVEKRDGPVYPRTISFAALAGGCTLVVGTRRARTVFACWVRLGVGAAGVVVAGVAAPTLRIMWLKWGRRRVATVRECGGRAEREHQD
jgi:hypothetical protein